MGKVIVFNKNPDSDERLTEIFDKIKEYYIRNRDDIKKDDKIRNLFLDFFNANRKYEMKTWKINSNRFLEKYNEVTYSDDLKTRIINEIQYINFYYVSEYIFSSLSVNDMSLLIRIRNKYNNLSEYKTKELIDKIANPFDKEQLSLLSEEEKEKYLKKYIDKIKEKESSKEEKYEANFQDIENYYINKAYDYLNYVGLDTEKFNDERVLNTVLKIHRIEKFNNIDKNKFLMVARHIGYISLTDEQEFTSIANLINIFLAYKHKVSELNTDDLIKILLIMDKNRQEELDTIIKKYESKEMR